jgi:hypothetical protein
MTTMRQLLVILNVQLGSVSRTVRSRETYLTQRESNTSLRSGLLGQVTWTSAKRHGSLGFELASHPFLLLVSASPVDYLEPRECTI